MRSVKGLLILAVFVLLCRAGWQVGSCEFANAQLQDDMKDLVAQGPSHIGRAGAWSDDDFRRGVIEKASEHEIQLDPDEVTVVRTGDGYSAHIYLAAEYTENVQLLGRSYQLHFTPATGDAPN